MFKTRRKTTMRNFNISNKFFARLTFGLTVILILSGVTFAQAKLRNALDYDGDGRADVGIFRGSNSTWYLLKSNGSVADGATFGSSNYDTIAPGDYDGDGKGDLAVWCYTNGTFYYLASGTNSFQARAFGAIGDEVVARDYDGDNKTDFAVVRRAGGLLTWYILNSLDGSFRSAQFGASTDLAVPGDYDGDGRFDLAVQRGGGATAAATHYVLGSTAGFYGVQFGLGTDMVVPGDYDGDGKTDVSIWRETDGTFYVLKTTDGAILGTQWGYTSDLPIAAYDVH